MGGTAGRTACTDSTVSSPSPASRMSGMLPPKRTASPNDWPSIRRGSVEVGLARPSGASHVRWIATIAPLRSVRGGEERRMLRQVPSSCR